MELQLQAAQADLKHAHKRIDSLQQALAEGQAEYSEDEDETVSSPDRKPNKKKKKKSYDDDASSDGSYQIGEGNYSDISTEDEAIKRTTLRRKQREKQRALEADDSHEKTFTRKPRASVSDEEEYKPRTRVQFSDDDDDIVKKPPRRYSDDEVPRKLRTDWRAIFSDDDDDDTGKKKASKTSRDDPPLSRKTKTYSDSEEEKPASRIKKASSYISDDDDDAYKTKSSWKSKYNFSDDSDKDISLATTTTSKKSTKLDLSDDDDYKPRRTYKRSDDEDIALSKRSRETTPSRSKPKRAWEHSSDEEYIPKTSSRNTKLPSDEDVPKRRTKDYLLDDDSNDDMPKLKHAHHNPDKSPEKSHLKKTSNETKKKEDSPSHVKFNLSNTDDTKKDPDVSVKIKAAAKDDKSYEAAKKRRERRRSKLSNTGSTENSPKRTGDK